MKNPNQTIDSLLNLTKLSTLSTNDNLLLLAKCAASINNIIAFKCIIETANIDLFVENEVFIKIAAYNDCCVILVYLLDNGLNATIDNNLPIKLYCHRCANYHRCPKSNVLQLLIDNNADVTIDNNYPLRQLAKTTRFDLVKILLDNGADITIDNNLVLKTFLTDPVAIEYLINKGADINSLECKDLINVITNSNVETVKLLASNGVDFGVINNCDIDLSNSDIKTYINLGIDPYILAHLMYNRMQIELNDKN